MQVGEPGQAPEAVGDKECAAAGRQADDAEQGQHHPGAERLCLRRRGAHGARVGEGRARAAHEARETRFTRTGDAQADAQQRERERRVADDFVRPAELVGGDGGDHAGGQRPVQQALPGRPDEHETDAVHGEKRERPDGRINAA